MMESVTALLPIILGGFAIIGQVLSVVFFIFKLAGLPQELKDFKDDIGVDIAAIRSDVKATRESVSGMRVGMAELKVQQDGDHSAIARMRDNDMAELRRDLSEVRKLRAGGGG